MWSPGEYGAIGGGGGQGGGGGGGGAGAGAGATETVGEGDWTEVEDTTSSAFGEDDPFPSPATENH